MLVLHHPRPRKVKGSRVCGSTPKKRNSYLLQRNHLRQSVKKYSQGKRPRITEAGRNRYVTIEAPVDERILSLGIRKTKSAWFRRWRWQSERGKSFGRAVSGTPRAHSCSISDDFLGITFKIQLVHDSYRPKKKQKLSNVPVCSAWCNRLLRFFL